MNFKFPQFRRVPLSTLIPHATGDAINLMESMLAYNPSKRPTAQQSLRQPYFQVGGPNMRVTSLKREAASEHINARSIYPTIKNTLTLNVLPQSLNQHDYEVLLGNPAANSVLAPNNSVLSHPSNNPNTNHTNLLNNSNNMNSNHQNNMNSNANHFKSNSHLNSNSNNPNNSNINPTNNQPKISNQLSLQQSQEFQFITNNLQSELHHDTDLMETNLNKENTPAWLNSSTTEMVNGGPWHAATDVNPVWYPGKHSEPSNGGPAWYKGTDIGGGGPTWYPNSNVATETNGKKYSAKTHYLTMSRYVAGQSTNLNNM
uniref:Uncharacterized protein n=1 Tax=Cacopsylla melanoneura TaxID=428564 RepID=A0A8D8SVZ2_9HEMI